MSPSPSEARRGRKKLQRLRALARERKFENRGDVKQMQEEDCKVFEAFRNSRDQANRGRDR